MAFLYPQGHTKYTQDGVYEIAFAEQLNEPAILIEGSEEEAIILRAVQLTNNALDPLLIEVNGDEITLPSLKDVKERIKLSTEALSEKYNKRINATNKAAESIINNTIDFLTNSNVDHNVKMDLFAGVSDIKSGNAPDKALNDILDFSNTSDIDKKYALIKNIDSINIKPFLKPEARRDFFNAMMNLQTAISILNSQNNLIKQNDILNNAHKFSKERKSRRQPE